MCRLVLSFSIFVTRAVRSPTARPGAIGTLAPTRRMLCGAHRFSDADRAGIAMRPTQRSGVVRGSPPDWLDPSGNRQPSATLLPGMRTRAWPRENHALSLSLLIGRRCSAADPTCSALKQSAHRTRRRSLVRDGDSTAQEEYSALKKFLDSFGSGLMVRAPSFQFAGQTSPCCSKYCRAFTIRNASSTLRPKGRSLTT